MAVVVAVSWTTVAWAAMPNRYRYTGWLAPLGGSPRHVIFEGDGGGLFFHDAFNLTKTPVLYSVCVRTVKTGRVRFCASQKAAIDVGANVVKLPDLCCGDFVAIWTVSGREVARWAFRYAAEGA